MPLFLTDLHNWMRRLCRRRARIGAAFCVLSAVLLLGNMAVIDRQRKDARITVEGAKLIATSEGILQVRDEGHRGGPPVVLVHGYACSLRWFDKLSPLLAKQHRVIRVDLLGHGGSGQPAAGYGIERQAAAIADLLMQLKDERATVVGHSLGGAVSTALAEARPDLVDRLVLIATPANPARSSLSLVSRVTRAPVVGQAIKSNLGLMPPSWIRGNYRQAFAPSFELAAGFEEPDQVVDDIRAMTHAAYAETWESYIAFGATRPLHQRLAEANLPLLVIFGERDTLRTDLDAEVSAFHTVPGAQVMVLPNSGHSPQIESPDETARLISDFIGH